MAISGIYKITNVMNGKIYIGQSLDIKGRIRRHKYQLKKGTHANGHLLSSFWKHGIGCFLFEVLFTVKDKIGKKKTIEILNLKEEQYIEEYDSLRSGYNLTSGGDNKVFSEQSVKKMSDSHKGNIPSLLCRQKISERMKGRTVSEATRQKISVATKATWAAKTDRSPNRKTGYKVGPASEERKRKIGAAQKGILNHNFGKNTPEEVKQKCRDSYHGTQCHLAKLDDDKVRAIKKSLLEGQTGRELAKKYGVATTQISSIKHGKTWRHIK